MKRYLSLILVVSVALTALAGCKRAEKKPLPQPPAPVRISFWHAMGRDSAHGMALANLVAQFNRSQNEVIVEAQYQGAYGDLDRKLTGAMVAGTAPTVIQGTDFMVANYARQKALVPLDNLVPQKERADFVPSQLEPYRIGGSLYGLPLNRSIVALIYDRTKIASPPRTWAEFRETAARFTGKNTAGIAMEPNVYTFASFYNQTGGQWLTDGRYSVAGKEGVQVLTMLKEMAEDGTAIFLKPGEYASDYFNNGRVPMIFTTSSSLAYVKPISRNPFGVAALPAGPAGNFSAHGGGGLAILSQSKPAEVQAAAKFVLWLTGRDATLQFAEARTGYLPVRMSALTHPRWEIFVQANPDYAELGDMLVHSKGLPIAQPEWLKVQTMLTEAVQAAIQGASPAEALATAEQKANLLLKPQ